MPFLAYIQTPTAVIDLDEWPTEAEALARARAWVPWAGERACACVRRSDTSAPSPKTREKLSRGLRGEYCSGREGRQLQQAINKASLAARRRKLT